MKRGNGFTLTEVVVAMVLLASLGGLAMLALSGSTRESSGTEGQCYSWGRFFMEIFYEDVGATAWPVAAGRVLSVDVPNTSGQSGRAQSYTVASLTPPTYTVCERYQVTSVDVNADAVEDYRRLRMVIDDTNCASASPFPV